MAEEFKPQYSFTDDRLNELKQLFPEAWEDGVFNVDTLRSLIGDHSTDNSVKEHFGLNWVGKQDARKIASKPATGTLKPAPGEGVNEENTENIFIEGDNLEVLKILRKSYMGKIKMIYIDPPYNTGNDFIYNDSFGDSTEDYLRKSGDKSEEGLLVSNPKTSGKFHANWLTFMYPRLRLAKDLLKDDGVIFISIDDNEVDNLVLTCNEIFGEENFLGKITWLKKRKGSFLSKKMVSLTEYCLVYSKSENVKLFGGKPDSSESQPLIKRTNPEGTLVFPEKTIKTKLKDGLYAEGLYGKGTSTVELLDDVIIKDGLILSKLILKGPFIWSQQHLDVMLEKGAQPVINTDSFQVRVFKPEDPDSYKGLGSFINGVEIGGTNEDGYEMLKDLFGVEKVMDYPKPINYLMKLIDSQMYFHEDEYVLDFFAGSGSTGHAVFEYNKRYKKKIKFILIQLNENIEDGKVAFKHKFKSISKISMRRLELAIEKSNYINAGVRVFSLVKSNIYKWKNFESQKDGLLPDLFTKLESAFKNPLVEGTTPEEFITEVMLQEGFPLTANQTEVQDGIFKISHDWVPYTLYVSMLQSFKNIDIEALGFSETDHFVCLDMAFENNDALKQTLDNQCKLFTV